jgi:hypothetical protein
VRDSLLCIVGGDSLRTYSVEDPTNPRRLGTCRVPGSAVAVSGNKAVVYYYDYMSVVDISNPTQPVSVGSYGAFVLGLAMRGNTVCANVVWNTLGDHFRFEVLDISNPASVRRIGAIDSVGGYDIHWDGPLAFVSGYYYNWEFSIVAMTDSTHPSVVSRCTTPGDGWGVWADLTSDRAYLADRYGLTVVDISDLGRPAVDTNFLRAGLAQDVCVDGGIAYIASSTGGMRIVDVSDPTRPRELAGVDTTNPQRSVVRAVAARDSFAYMGWPNWDNVLTLDVSNPTRPVKVGGCDLFNLPEAMVLRDSFIYVAEAYRFQVVNVARPRQPVLVGSCVLPGTPGKLELNGTTAYVATQGVQCVDIADPSNPRIVGSYGSARVSGLVVVDTVVYGAGPYTGLIALSVADPAAPRLLDSLWLTDTLWWSDLVVVGSMAYLGGEHVWAVDVSDPQDLRRVTGVSWAPPGFIERMVYAEPHIYVACLDAGVCILESTAVGIADCNRWRDAGPALTVTPNPTSGRLDVRIAGLGTVGGVWTVRDVTGRAVRGGSVVAGAGRFTVDMSAEPSGVYVIELEVNGKRHRGRIVKL